MIDFAFQCYTSEIMRIYTLRQIEKAFIKHIQFVPVCNLNDILFNDFLRSGMSARYFTVSRWETTNKKIIENHSTILKKYFTTILPDPFCIFIYNNYMNSNNFPIGLFITQHDEEWDFSNIKIKEVTGFRIIESWETFIEYIHMYILDELLLLNEVIKKHGVVI